LGLPQWGLSGWQAIKPRDKNLRVNIAFCNVSKIQILKPLAQKIFSKSILKT
jgi:hypothetical protein